MYELHQVGENSYYIQSPAKIGLVRINDTNVCLIDSGNDKDAGRKVRKILDEKGWHLTAIYNTHSNADHIGGNRYLQQQTGCRIYAPGIECDFTRHPVLEPAFLYGGFPPKDLRHKFLMAQESGAEELCVEGLTPEKQIMEKNAAAKTCQDLEVIALPGHFFDMVGYRSRDDVVYLADCLSSRETLEKYQISFLYDVESYLRTLEMVKGLKAAMFVPAHAEVAEDVSELAQFNIDKVHEIAEQMVSICREPKIFEKILKELFDFYSLQLNFEQYVLVGSTVRSYLAWLKDKGRLEVVFRDNELLWAACEKMPEGVSS